MKSQKSNVCYQHIGKCLALVFCRTVFVSWWRVYLLASSCLNWCLVEHSSVKTQRHLLVCPFLTHLLSHKPPPPSSSSPSSSLQYLDWYSQGCLQCLHFLSVWEIQNSPPLSPPFSLPSGVCVKCTLPWFFFIQYSVTCLCKFGLEKINLFMRLICPGTCSVAPAPSLLCNWDDNTVELLKGEKGERLFRNVCRKQKPTRGSDDTFRYKIRKQTKILLLCKN